MQTEPVRRKVALKIIKPGMDSKQVIARFEVERQALAMMDPPNIARVMDGGATEGGQPFFVMELVSGLPITEYCDEQQLTVSERLRLFVKVCRALQHAHQKGVIHRDLKPSNVLVAEIDDEAVPKVIDFGVAKAISQKLSEQTVYTQFAQMVGTPLYMSPEQAGLGVVDVDTRSDVYSLGVLLYEVLTGSTPFDREALKRDGFDEFRRVIREQEPRRPSAMVSTLGAQALRTVAARRHSSPQKLSEGLRGGGSVFHPGQRKQATRRTRLAAAASGVDRDLSKFYDQMEDQQTVLGQQEQALRSNERQIDIREKLVQRYPDVPKYKAELSYAYWALGNFLQTSQPQQAEEWYRRAITIQQEAALPFYRANLAAQHRHFARHLAQRNQLDDAIEHFRKAIAIYEKLTAEYPHVSAYQGDLARSQLLLGDALRQTEHEQQAEQAFRKAVTLAADVTELGGVYAFTVDDELGTYRIHETQPSGVDQGAAIVGDADGDGLTGEAADGSVLSSNEMQLTLTGMDATDYDFTELGQAMAAGDTAGIGFWQNRRGQALIEEGGQALVGWLETNFGNIVGNTFSDGSGGDDAAEVASFYKNEFFKKKIQGSPKVDAQFMSVAFATFFTSRDLSGGDVAANYGFNVTDTGIGTNVVNVGNSGAAFNVADNTDVAIMALLLATNDLTGPDADGDASEDYSRIYDADGDGILDDEEKSWRAMADAVYSLINESGGI